MSCEVKIFGKIRDFQKVQEYFGLPHDESWFNAISYAISPTGELIALGHGEKLALLTSCWDNKTQLSTYVLSWCGEIEFPNEIITALLCLPIYGKTVSSGSEWTCVAVGLSSGMVAFYTETGIKIYSQNYQEDAVLYIKSYSPPPLSESDSFVYVVYNKCVCIIKGADIFPLLGNSRHNLNRTFGRNSTITQKPLETDDTLQFQKFIFPHERETAINDAVVVGSQLPCAYDYMIEQCLGFGYFARIAETPVQRSLVLGVGVEPYLGLYLAEEGYKTVSIGAVIGMAYKNIIGNLFRRSTAAAADVLPEEQQSAKDTQMRSRCRFFDGKRDGIAIAIAPGGRLAAVADNLDRVLLVDPQRSLVLRVWKGYRDAQCAFVPVKEKILKGAARTHRRKALFLIIYAPRLGCLEIWALQNGPKVAAFNVSKSGQLAYNTHGLMGGKPGAKIKATINCCLFLDPSDASVKEIQIPFHFALSESNSKTSRDVHLLRRLKTMLRDANEKEIAEFAALAGDFQTLEVRQQCVEMLQKNKQIDPRIFQAIICAFAEKIAVDIKEETNTEAEETAHFCNLLQNYKSLVEFYLAMKSQQKVDHNFIEPLELSDSDLVTINQLVLLLGNPNRTHIKSNLDTDNEASKVKFEDECKNVGDFVDYLSIFQVDVVGFIPLQRTEARLFGYVSGKLFGDLFAHSLCFEEFKKHAAHSNIPTEDLLVLAVHFWIEKPFAYQNCDEVIADLSRLAAMVRAICELEGDAINNFAYNAISPWWQKVREMLLESPNSLGLLVAIVCKTVASQLRRGYKEGSCDEGSQTEEEERWEQITHDEAQWGLLIGKLEDIAVLGAILENPLLSAEPVMPELPHETPNCSLKYIVNGGKGIVTDLTAQWLINARINPAKIVEESTVDIQKSIEAIENEESKIETDEKPTIPDQVVEKLTLLRKHFPFSLQSGMLLSHMSWQYMVYWSKHLHSVQHMRASLTCLEHFKAEDLALKHGMCCMEWNATLKYPLQSTMKLIQKMGKLPTDKLCQQDLQMSAAVVPDFLELCLEFLQHFATSLDHEKRDIKFEESLTEGPIPLQFIALQQHHAIKELLQLHYQLCAVLHFIAFFQLKVHKPIATLFDAMSNKAFFADINKELAAECILTAPDPVLQQRREEFLCKVISVSMDLIREDLEQLFVLEHVQTMVRVNALAESWNLNKKVLHRKQVVEMYAHGYDTQGEQLLRVICDEDDEIGEQLLEIAGRRLNLYANKSQEIYLKIASVGGRLLMYLDNLHPLTAASIQISASEVEEIDIVALCQLLTVTYECLCRHGSECIHIATQMFDAVAMLQDNLAR